MTKNQDVLKLIRLLSSLEEGRKKQGRMLLEVLGMDFLKVASGGNLAGAQFFQVDAWEEIDRRFEEPADQLWGGEPYEGRGVAPDTWTQRDMDLMMLWRQSQDWGGPIAPLAGVDFSDCDLNSSHFDYADLEGANFNGANLEGASFKEAKLGGATFNGASLTGADFEGADLSGVDLGEASHD